VRAKGVSAGGTLVALALSCFTAAPVAAGLEPGVHADPGSPAAKEYALPLTQARGTGGGAPGTAPAGAAGPFGAGIKPFGSRRSGLVRSSASNIPNGARLTTSGASYDSGIPVPAIVLRAAHLQSSSNGSGSILTLLGGGVAVLILGAFGGTLIRRSRRSLPSA
jgi:hypothetical protein